MILREEATGCTACLGSGRLILPTLKELEMRAAFDAVYPTIKEGLDWLRDKKYTETNGLEK